MQAPALRRYAVAGVLLLMPICLVHILLGAVTIDIVTVPPAFPVLAIHYGAGALISRELARRWGKGAASILLFGAAYGVFNEGVDSGGYFATSFYTFVGLGAQNSAPWAGINIAGAMTISTIHALFATAVPIFVVDALFPRFAQHRLLGDKALTGLFALYVVATAMLIVHRQPPVNPAGLALAAAAAVGLTVAAELLPASPGYTGRRTPGELASLAIGFFGAFVWLVVLPNTLASAAAPAAVHAATGLGVMVLVFGLFLRLPEVGNRRSLAFAAGAEAPFLAHAVTSGLVVPAALTLVLLVAARHRCGTFAARPPPTERESG